MKNNLPPTYSNTIIDCGPKPLIVNMDYYAKQNSYYRRALWTGTHLQVTLMSIPVNGNIGLEMHPHLDQFIRIEDGSALVVMGNVKNCFNVKSKVDCNHAIIIPAGTWHNLINIGCTAVKLYSIYAPPEHLHGILEETKSQNESCETNYVSY